MSQGKVLAQATGRQPRVIRTVILSTMRYSSLSSSKAAALAGLGLAATGRTLTKTTTIKG